jgi:hypothetical protein
MESARQTGRIPKILFQTSKNPLDPGVFEALQPYLTDEWTYRHYVDADILEFFKSHPNPEFPEIADRFLSFPRGEHRADLFRYYHLYMKGGLFLDSDAMIYKPLDEIIGEYSFISVKSGMIKESFFNGLLGAEANHQIIYSALYYLYTMELNTLENNYSLVCKSLFQMYSKYDGDKSVCKIYSEINRGYWILDESDKTLVCKHFWDEKEYIPRVSTNLIYLCVFYNEDYIELLILLLKSFLFFSKTEGIDILILTQPSFEFKIRQVSIHLNLYLKVHVLDYTTLFQAACARLSIFDVPGINKYEKILYLDTDILIKADLAPLFSVHLNDLLYGLESGEISSPSFGSQFFDFNQISPKTSGINSGTLLFKPSPSIQGLFQRIREHIETHVKANLAIPYCMDQPFVNYHAIKGALYDNTLLKSHVSLFEGNDSVNNYDTSCICHFSYPIGNFAHKYKRMVEFAKKIFDTQFKGLSIPNYICGTFSFGSSGRIEFKEESLSTTWGSGNYQILDADLRIVKVFWNNHYHIFKFNSSFNKYLSVRIYPADFEIQHGRKSHRLGPQAAES